MIKYSNLPTYKVLHKDLNLKHLGLGRYDREWVAGDFKLVDGLESLHNGIRIKLMTIWGEMVNNPTFKQWGNMAWAYIKANNVELTRTAIKDKFKQALSEMRRILSVDDIKIKQDTIDPNKLIVTYLITSISDQTLSGGVELI